MNTRKAHSNLLIGTAQLCKVIIKSALIVLICLVSSIYYQTVIFNFLEPTSFSGENYYNPYQNWQEKDTYKANFHAHSVAWSGITDGHNTPEEILRHYKGNGYKIAGLSNYHHIDKTELNGLINLPMYEHGCNIRKTHKLAIGARKVDYLDFPLWQNTSQKQLVINNIKRNDGLVALAHPNNRNGHTLDDIKYLSDYDFIEVMSPSANAQEHWDMALKNGKVVWALANDDTHDLVHQKPGRFYNVLCGPTENARLEKKKLKSGNFYAVSSPDANTKLGLSHIRLKNDTVSFAFQGNITQIRAVSDGKTIAILHAAEGKISIPENASYLRFEVKTDSDILLTNPIIKSSGAMPLNTPMYEANFLLTILFRLTLLSLTAFLLFLFLNRKQKRFINVSSRRLRNTIGHKIRTSANLLFS